MVVWIVDCRPTRCELIAEHRQFARASFATAVRGGYVVNVACFFDDSGSAGSVVLTGAAHCRRCKPRNDSAAKVHWQPVLRASLAHSAGRRIEKQDRAVPRSTAGHVTSCHLQPTDMLKPYHRESLTLPAAKCRQVHGHLSSVHIFKATKHLWSVQASRRVRPECVHLLSQTMPADEMRSG